MIDQSNERSVFSAWSLRKYFSSSTSKDDEELLEGRDPGKFPDLATPKSLLLKSINDYDEDADQFAYAKYSKWYVDYLHTCIEALLANEEWHPILSQLYRDDEGRPKPSLGIYQELYNALVNAANVLNSDNASVQNVASQLSSNIEILEGDERFQGACYQLSFKLISWLTMLYTTSDSPCEHGFQLSLHNSPDLRSASWWRLKCAITEDTISQPLRHLLPHFGDLLPQPLPPLNARRNDSSFRLDSIISANLSYYTLSNVAEIRVVWVDALSLHLEFDERTAILKLFRYPSFCAMLCVGQVPRQTVFSKIFSNFDAMSDSSHTPSTLNSEENHPYSQAYFKEVLFSYYIIFGQHQRARNGYKTMRPNPSEDPLLDNLCTNTSHPIYSQISVPTMKTVYSARNDFPSIGARLLKVHDYVETRNPSDLRTLMHDRRDLLRFYTFWAVVVVGGFGILLGLLQFFTGIVQIILAAIALRS